MKIKFENIGYIKQAIIDLDKDLIILCGPNNTGKTYLATALYGLFRYNMINSMNFSVIKDFLANINDLSLIDLDGFLTLDVLDQILKDFSKNYVSRLHEIFSVDKDFFEKTNITFFDVDYENFKNNLKNKVLLKTVNISFSSDFSLNINKSKDCFTIYCTIQNGENNRINKSFLLRILTDIISELLISILIPKSFMAPVERIAINLFSRELSIRRNELVDKLLALNVKKDDPFSLIESRATRYPLPVRDSLKMAEDLENLKRRQHTEFSDIADQLENKILKGKILISKNGDVIFKSNKNKVQLNTHMSASVVKSLSNLVIYFRHFAKANDFIIIDEPELNLHPDNQILIARILSQLVINKGFKLLISTHSDYIIKEFNNLILLNSYKNKFDIFPEYSIDMAINPEKVSALLFNYDKQSIDNLEIKKSGFEVSTIDDVIYSLNKRFEALYFGDAFDE